MFNPVDTNQIRSLIEYKREQLASDVYRTQKAVEDNQPRTRRWKRVRIAVGTRLIRAGARIAGTYTHELPRLRTGV